MLKFVVRIACLGVLVLFSCNNEDFELGKHLVNSPFTFGRVDTVTINVSNMVAADSVVSGGRGFGYWGTYNDPLIGLTKAKTFIEFNRPVEGESNREAIFDSVTIVLRPNGNYYGDTTKLASVNIYRLKEQIERDNFSSFYSTSQGPDVEMLANKEFRIGIKDIQNNEIEFRLRDDSWAQELFFGIVSNDEEYRGSGFQNSFPGLAIGTGSNNEDCIYGFFVNDTTCMIRIYYHINTTFRDERTMTLAANQFNSFYNLEIDKNDELLFDSRSASVPSSKTGNRGFVMSGGSPMFARLEFPHLNEFLWLGQVVVIQRAILHVRPVRRSFDVVPLPPQLNIYYFNPVSNTPMGTALGPPSMSGSRIGTQFGNLPEDYRNIQSPNIPHYTFDVTDFIAGQLGAVGHEKWALSIIIADEARENTIQRLVFGDQNYPFTGDQSLRIDNQISLEITYAAYND